MRFVAHHVAHAASAALAAPVPQPGRPSSVLVLDGRGEQASHLSGRYEDGRLDTLATQQLPHSLGLLYESLTEHLGFLRSSDEFKVMALASYGRPRHLARFRETVFATETGGFEAPIPEWSEFAPPRPKGDGEWSEAHADLACSVQARLEEVLVDLATWLHARTGDRPCVSRAAWRSTASRTAGCGGDATIVGAAAAGDGTSLGAALQLTADLARDNGGLTLAEPFTTAALGRGWTDDELAAALRTAAVPFTTPDDLAGEVADILAANGVIAGSTGGANSGRGRWDSGHFWPIPAMPRTSSGSTPSRAASSSGPSRRWCSWTGPTRSSTGDRSRVPTCSSSIGWLPSGSTASRPSSTSTARPASRRSTRRASRDLPA